MSGHIRSSPDICKEFFMENKQDKTHQLGSGGLTAMIIGSTIGAGIFTIAGDMASNGAHTGSVLIGWGICGIERINLVP